MLGEIVWDKDTLAVLMVFLIPIVGVVASMWMIVEKNRAECELKRSMIERGMSADEIERIIAAKGPKK